MNTIKPENNFRIYVINYYYNRKDNFNVYLVNTFLTKLIYFRSYT